MIGADTNHLIIYYFCQAQVLKVSLSQGQVKEAMEQMDNGEKAYLRPGLTCCWLLLTASAACF